MSHIAPDEPAETTADRLWDETLADIGRCETIERLWMEILPRLYPDLQIADLSARFLQPWRRLGAEQVTLRQLAGKLSVSPADLAGWHALVGGLLRSLGDASQEERDSLTLRFSRELLGVVRDSPPERPALRLVVPSSRSGQSGSPLPEHWTARAGLVGAGGAMQEIYRSAAEAARDRYPTLILGETGTGKEVVARLIHHLSPDRGTFVAVNCAALPDSLIECELFGHVRGAFTGASGQRTGLFAEADGGTLLLDEMSETSLHQQAKILRVLQDGLIRRVGSSRYEPVDVRVIATSNRDLEGALSQGRLRRDLYYRLAVHEIRVPPLREHPEDIPELMAAFVDRWHKANPDLRMPFFDPGAVGKLSSSSWPGNVRQLEHTVYRLASRFCGRTITSASVDGVVDSTAQDRELGTEALSETRLDDVERKAVERALAVSGGNKTTAAHLLGVSRKTLYNKIRRYGLSRTDA